MGFEIKGLDEVKKVFANLSEIEQFKFFADEFKPIGKILETSMKQHTPVAARDSKSNVYASRSHARGNLRNSIGMKIGGSSIPVVWVNLNRKRGYDAWYDHIVVGGHSWKGATVPPRPIVTDTWNAVGGAVTAQLENRLKNKLQILCRP